VVKLKWLVAVAACGLAFGARPVRACQYNVREVGFIDVGIEPYRLIVYLPENIPAGEMSKLKEAMVPALDQTNVRFEPVVAGADANQPAMEFARAHGISRFPAAVLVSPDGPSMPVTVPEKAASLAEAVPSALQSILDSPTRRQILERSADSYGAVLLIEGPDPQRNRAAREAVSAAISQIGAQLESLPKPISKPPQLVVLDQKSLAREQVLLWTLRLKAEDVNQPHAAVFYGRGRWIGPLFEGETLTSDNLMQLLSVVGADCECSLDHRWLQGTMLPARWDEALQQKVVQSVGFDPENPMTKMEMVSIVRRGMGGSDYPGVPFDYREIQVGGDADDDRGQRTEDGGQKTVPSSVFPPPSSGIVGQVLAGSLAGVVALVGLASLAVVLRARRP
jgi:hypothetical protein